MMGDMGEDFKALREHRKTKRQANKISSTEILTEKGIEFESKNFGEHLIIKDKKAILDFYPSTGLFIDRATKNKGRGIFKLLKKLGATP